MPCYYTHYWTNETRERERRYQETGRTGDLLCHTASNQFVERGIESGDFLYAVTVMEGALYVLGRMNVGKVCSAEEAASILGTHDLYEASDHAVAAEATPKHFDLEVPLEVIERLAFISDGSPRLKFSSPGSLDRQTLRGWRELEPRSAAELDKLLAYPRRGSGKEKPAFEVGRVYNRRDDLHAMYGASAKGVYRHRRTNPSYCCSPAGAESNTATGTDGTKTASSSTPERAKRGHGVPGWQPCDPRPRQGR